MLRNLLTSWTKVLGDNRSYFYADDDRRAGPMPGALDCLAKHDNTCHKRLRSYCLTRDGEHETYACDTVLLDFVQRNALTNIKTLGLAIFFILLRDQDGRYLLVDGKVFYPWDELRIVQAARTVLQPDDFAHLMEDEIAYWGRDASGMSQLIDAFLESLDLTKPRDAKAHSPLSV